MIKNHFKEKMSNLTYIKEICYDLKNFKTAFSNIDSQSFFAKILYCI